MGVSVGQAGEEAFALGVDEALQLQLEMLFFAGECEECVLVRRWKRCQCRCGTDHRRRGGGDVRCAGGGFE